MLKFTSESRPHEVLATLGRMVCSTGKCNERQARAQVLAYCDDHAMEVKPVLLNLIGGKFCCLIADSNETPSGVAKIGCVKVPPVPIKSPSCPST